MFVWIRMDSISFRRRVLERQIATMTPEHSRGLIKWMKMIINRAGVPVVAHFGTDSFASNKPER
jgi:hypothetical protein